MFVPYLSFQGQAAEAFAAYAAIFGGTPETMRFADAPPGTGMPDLPPEQRDWLMHARLTTPDGGVLMGADMPPQVGGQPQAGVSVAVSRPDSGEAQALFQRLAERGTVTMPFAETFFAKGFGMCRDRFGTHWMVSVDEATEERTPR